MQNYLDNVPEFSVSELSIAIKRNLEHSFGYVKIRGEISGFRKHSSGHLYFNIKDENAVVNGVCFRSMAMKLDMEPEEGQEVVVFGQITSYPARSNYQILISKISPAGIGSLMALLEKRKKEFTRKGYFLPEHKKPIPKFPKKIAVITSETGAVIQDIIHRIEERFPIPILLAPARVQGKDAEIQIVEHIKSINDLDSNIRPDVIIIARGGGSIEDLWCFNEEILIEEVFKSKIPIISAVGHETDTTLIDYASDLRAPTPTAAAELATPNSRELKQSLQKTHMQMFTAISRKINDISNQLTQIDRFFKSPGRIINDKMQQIDELLFRADKSLNFIIERKRQKVSFLHSKISHNSMLNRLNANQEKFSQYYKQLQKCTELKYERIYNKATSFGKLLSTLSYKNTLKRGFAVVRDDNNHIVSNSSSLANSKEISLEFYDSDKKVKIL